MKLCPICDNKIQGRWCPRCFRFVTPWEIKNEMYINESHNARNDAGCEYHNPRIENDSQAYVKQGFERKVYGAPSAGAKQKKGGKKVVVIIIIVYIIIFLCTVFSEMIPELIDSFKNDTKMPEISNLFGEISTDMDKEPASEPDNYNIDYDNIDDEKINENRTKRIEYLSGIEPADVSKSEYGFTIYYYEPEDISKASSIQCDEGHFDCDVQVIRDIVGAYDEQTEWSTYSDSSMNYVYDDGDDYNYATFDTDYDCRIGETTVSVRVDTASGKIHSANIVTFEGSDEFYEITEKICNTLIPGAFNSTNDLKTYLETTGSSSEDFGNFNLHTFVFADYISIQISVFAE